MTITVGEKATAIVGFISPPAWYDPSPSEFLRITEGAVRVQQYILPLRDFDWRIESIAASEPDQILAARALAQASCDVIAGVGTPFGWAGLPDATAARKRQARLESAAGKPVVMTSTAVVDALNSLGARRVGLACTYYTDDWRDAWSAFIAASGFEVSAARNLSDQGLAKVHDASDAAFWAPDRETIKTSLQMLVSEAPDFDAIVVSGAGARTLSIIGELEDLSGKPVMGSDTALYWAIARAIGIRLRPNLLGRLTRC